MWRFRIVAVLLAVSLVIAGFYHEARAEEPKKVVFIRYRIEPAFFATVLKGFKEKMASRGFIEGRNVNYVDILTRSADQTSLPDVIDGVNRHKDTADMFITCGWVSMKAREMLKESGVPQLFVPVLESVALKMLPSLIEPPQTNLSGIYLMYPPEKILRIARFVIPEIKNYAYVYDSRIPADLIFKSAYQDLPPEKMHGISIHYLDLGEGVERVRQAMAELKIEAYGGIVGSFKNQRELARSGVPVITSLTLDIEQESLPDFLDENTLAGLFNPFRYCGNQAAEMTADIFDGLNSIENTVPRAARQVAFVNLKAATNLNRPISVEVLETVDVIIK
ncbi:MAG: hypothetical protein KKG47_16410 [Proteobacteria bacterium]|nr:hypothetical protein [Pseudomonadota bacterium]MBU1739674.1 hypothetical protein [Pseudomonadota bacterium]